MMGLAAIIALSDELAEIAQAEGKLPFVPQSEAEIQTWKTFPFPNIGSFVPEGWEIVDHTQADKGGVFDGFSLGIDGLKDWTWEMVQQWEMDGEVGFAIIEEGQFQLVVGCFVKG